MVRANIAEFKTNISRYLKLLKLGQRVTICERNVPIATVEPIPAPRAGRRPIGEILWDFEVPDEVWAPLTDTELKEMFGDAF